MSGWTLPVLVAINLTGMVRTATAQEQDPITVSVYVLNQAGIPEGVLGRGLAEAARIYGDIGITLAWTENAASEYRFAVRITTMPLGGNNLDRHALGAAPGTKQARGTSAYAYYDPIAKLAHAAGTDVANILGHIIAHELGHLLLPHDSHTMVGVMGTGWDRAQVESAKNGDLTFTRDQAKKIRKFLAGVKSGVASSPAPVA